MSLKFISAAGALTALALATGASAQTAPAPAAAPAVTGPVIPGVCVYSNARAIGTSAVGKAVETRMQQLTQQVEAELKAEQTALQTEAKALDAQKASIPQDQLQQRALTLNQKGAALERKAQIRSRELEVTQGKAIDRIAKEVQPLLQQTYNERNCGLMIDRNAVLAGNAQMDVTDTVIQKLNAKIQTMSFERERLDQQQQAAAAPAAKPAAAAPTKK